MTPALLLACSLSAWSAPPEARETAKPSALERVRAACIEPAFSQAACVFTESPLHGRSHGSGGARLFVNGFYLAFELATLPAHAARSRFTDSSSLDAWRELVAELRAKADRERLPPRGRASLAACVSSHLLDYGHDAAVKASAAVGALSRGTGECTEFARLAGALAEALDVDARFAATGGPDEFPSHAMVDVRLPDAPDPDAWYRFEPQSRCGPGAAPCRFQRVEPR